MKVIAITETSYVVDMSVIEMDLLTGAKHSSRINNGPYASLVGSDFNIASAWNALSTLREGRDTLPATAMKLRAIADMLAPLSMEIPAIT